MKKLAKELETVIPVSFYEAGDHRQMFNSVAVIDADGRRVEPKFEKQTDIRSGRIAAGCLRRGVCAPHGRPAVPAHGGGGDDRCHRGATMQAPQYAQPGQDAQELWVRLELKVIADVGLVGFPNVGKSTFLSRVTNARPKIANYHFTTLNPNLGVVDLDGGKGFVIADIPGLIEGASEGVGLGHQFLRHIERTKVIIHIVDAASTEGRDPIADIKAINKELENYNPKLLERPQVIAANKITLKFRL